MKNTCWHNGLFLFLLALTIYYCWTSPTPVTADTPYHMDPATTAGKSGMVRMGVAEEKLQRLIATHALGCPTGSGLVNQEWVHWGSELIALEFQGGNIKFHGQVSSPEG